ncbi:MAG TPA: Fe-S cluster assembly protein SufD [Candidatus Limnocylindrales bacterium]|nr:Fe-S cluster assembly protein SufD [Candidatus Limnocylindrales bacterium]
MTAAIAEQTGAWLADFTSQPAAEGWLRELRNEAFERFSRLGFPTTRDEEWRFTNVAPIARARFSRARAERIVRVPEGVTRLTLGDAQTEAHLGKYASTEANAFVALNTAFLNDVIALEIPRGAVIAEPIEIDIQIAQAGAAHPRLLVIAGANSQAAIVESYSGAGKYFTNAVTEIVAGEGAVIDHYKVQRESGEAFHIATLQAQLGRSATFSTHNISLGGALVRNDVNAVLSEGTEATVNGLYIANGSQHVDNHTVIDHAKPHGASHELYKGILDDRAHAVFNGRIIVRKDAQKTDSKQTNKNLVLSDDAVIDTKPELQIHADDVRCTHGATIGQLDAEAMFYLRSRGIGRSEARSLLTYAFAQDVVDRIKIPALKESLEKYLFEKFHEHHHQ